MPDVLTFLFICFIVVVAASILLLVCVHCAKAAMQEPTCPTSDGPRILADHEIRSLCLGECAAITPFEQGEYEDPPRKAKISYGLTSYGYDIRIQHDARIFTPVFNGIVDPLRFDAKKVMVHVEAETDPEDPSLRFITIPPNSFALVRSMEKFDIPSDCLIVCLGKSTYARCGVIVNITPLEPTWKGELTIELSNTSPNPVRIYTGLGIAQLLFFKGNPCELTYADKKGKYQNQEGITYAKAGIG